MTLNEIVEKLLSLNICYQVKIKKLDNFRVGLMNLGIPEDPETEDYENIGYNKEKEKSEQIKDDEKIFFEKLLEAEVITDKTKLLEFPSWHLAVNPPKKENIKASLVRGAVITVYIEKGTLYIRGDDAPFGSKAIHLAIEPEYIEDIKCSEDKRTLMFITKFFQMAIRIPDNGV